MSNLKKCNRNIQSVSLLNHYDLSNYPSVGDCIPYVNKSFKKQEHLFGELVREDLCCSYHEPESISEEYVSPTHRKTNWNELKSDDIVDLESVTSGLSEIKLVQSLSSSPSWSDDNDIDGSKKVQDELERMDRVLKGMEPIPLHYDVEEYKEWMETFPNISLFDENQPESNKKCKNEEPKSDSSIKLDNIRPRTDYNDTNLKEYKDKIKKAVINNIYENISLRINNKLQSSTHHKLEKSHPSNNLNETQTYLRECLKNSPFSRVIEGRYDKNSFMCQHNSQEDEIQEKSPRFESLPLLSAHSNRSNKFGSYKNDSLRRRKSRKSIILPPIENHKLNSSNQFRSVSATPLYTTLLSSKSLSLESKLLSGTRRF